MLADKITGDLREVDILISSNLSTYKVLIAIEVVARGRKADTPWIESMYSKHNSLPTDKLILVSEKGFSVPALIKAKYLGVDAITIEKALSTNWEVATQLNGQGFIEKTSLNYSCAMIYEFEDRTTKEIQVQDNLEIVVANKKTTVGAIVDYELNSEDFRNIVEEQISISDSRELQIYVEQQPTGFFISEIDGREAKATKLKIYVFIDHTKTPVEFFNGKYKNNHFVTGVSTPLSSDKLQFVVVKNADGSSEASIIDGNKIHKVVERKNYKL